MPDFKHASTADTLNDRLRQIDDEAREADIISQYYRRHHDDETADKYAARYEALVHIVVTMTADNPDYDKLANLTGDDLKAAIAWGPEPATDSAKRQRLAELEAEFEAAGGRGVELAEEIDALRAELARWTIIDANNSFHESQGLTESSLRSQLRRLGYEVDDDLPIEDVIDRLDHEHEGLSIEPVDDEPTTDSVKAPKPASWWSTDGLPGAPHGLYLLHYDKGPGSWTGPFADIPSLARHFGLTDYPKFGAIYTWDGEILGSVPSINPDDLPSAAATDSVKPDEHGRIVITPVTIEPCEWFLNNGRPTREWCCFTHRYAGGEAGIEGEDHPDQCPDAEGFEERVTMTVPVVFRIVVPAGETDDAAHRVASYVEYGSVRDGLHTAFESADYEMDIDALHSPENT